VLVLKLAWRSLWRNRRRTFITLSSIALGLSMAIFFIAFADGVYAQMIDDAVRTQAGHLTLEHEGYRDAPSVDLVVDHLDRLRPLLTALPGVEGSKALVLAQGVARTGNGSVGVAVMGVEPAVERLSSPIARHVVAGSYLDDEPGRWAIVGRTLADRLKLEVGKKMVLTSNDVHGELVEELVRVRGIFELGAEEVDGFLVELPIDLARKIYGLGPQQATQLGLLLRDPRRQQALLDEVRALLPAAGPVALPWQEVLPDLASYIRLDRGSNLLFQGVILFLIGFTIFNTLLMSVLERKHEFAVLLALGTPRARIQGQVVVESLLLGILGAVLGTAIGGGLAWAGHVYGIDLRSFMAEGTTVSGFAMNLMVHARFDLSLLLSLAGLVLTATVLLGVFSMRHAVRVSLADVLR